MKNDKPFGEFINSNIYVQAAHSLGLDVEILDVDKKIYEISNKKVTHRFKGWTNSLNNVVSSTIAKEKNLTYKVLALNNITPPKHISLNLDKKNVKVILNFCKKNSPFVIKPGSGTVGEGVFIGLESPRDIKMALNQIEKLGYKEVLVEEFIKGKDYRILMSGKKIIDILERIPAFVKGDGVNTIKSLIDKKNKERKKMGIHEIKFDVRLKRFLSDQKLGLNSIPKKEEVITLRANCNFSEGGETHRIALSSVHPDNLELFKKAHKACGLHVSGIDFITPDISKSHKEVRCIINEINSAPEVVVHYYADKKRSLEAPKDILREMFGL